MDLHEEYHRRRGLKSNLVKYTHSQSYLLLRADPSAWDSYWALHQIKWAGNGNRPGTFQIQLLVPNHDGVLGSGVFRTISDDKVEWDAYEAHLATWCNSRKGLTPVHFSEIKLALWNIFLYAADTWIARSDPDADLLFKSLDESEPIEVQQKAIDELLSSFAKTRSDLYQRWEHLKCYSKADHYDEWLADMMDSSKKA